ncbi:MAG: hypothetical protein RRY21_03670, partial [Oscillospiraceae bacterium]
MLKSMMLLLVLLLITLSAAQLGRDKELTEVLRRAKTPVASAPQSAVGAVSGEAGPKDPAASDGRQHPPRFVLDEPMPSLPPLSELYPGSQPASGAGIDPSARHKVSSGDESEAAPSVRIPTEQEKRDAVEPYAKELYALKTRCFDELSRLEGAVMAEYLSLPPDRRAEQLSALFGRYYPRAIALEQQTDAEAETVLAKMEAALAASGADNALAETAR